MLLKFFRSFLVFACLLVLSGCDPVTLVKEKVPKPIQSLLSFGSPAKSKGAKPVIATLKLITPKNKELFSVDKEVAFQAEYQADDVKKKEGPQFTWMLFKEPDGKGVKAGTAKSFKKKLEPGNYRVEVTVAHGEQKLVKKSDFRVAFTAKGQVVMPDGAGLGGVEIMVMEPSSDKAVSKTETDPKGAFTAEVLSEGNFVVIPRKKEYSFWPARETAKLGREPVALDFKAVKAEIDKLRLTEDAQTDASLEAICPGQDTYLKFDFKAEDKPTRLEAFLVAREQEKEKLIQLDQVYEPSDHKTPADFGDERKPLQLKVPLARDLGRLAPSYHLRANFTDTKGNLYSAEGQNAIKIDVNMCFRNRFQRAVALHQEKKLEQAEKSYAEAIDFGKILQENGHLPADMPKLYFDRGLVEMSLAFAREAGDAKRLDFLEKAISSFNDVLKTHKKDADAILLRGIAFHSVGNYKAAIKDYDEVLSIDPDSTEVKKLRALAYVKTGLKENLSSAVDDFTDVITNDPSAQELRKSRIEALKLGAEPSTKTDYSRVDIASVPLPDMREGLKLSNRIRK